VSWSENIIFGNMWVASVQKWLEAHSQELGQAAFQEVGDIDNGLASQKFPLYAHWHRSHNGVLSSFEYLRRHVFGGWTLDKGLLRGLLRHVWQPGYGELPRVSVGDFGAGGGRYSEWLNETGLVESFAFDAVQSVSDISGGRVQEVDLASPVTLWRTFDWVICLEVLQHMPQKKVATLLQNLRRHTKFGIVVSWTSPPIAQAGIEQVDAAKSREDASAPLSEAGFIALVERETGLSLDRMATTLVRESCELPILARTVAVFRVSE